MFARMGLNNVRIGPSSSSQEETVTTDDVKKLQELRVYERELEREAKQKIQEASTIVLPNAIPESVREVSEDVIELVRKPNVQPEAVVGAMERLMTIRDRGTVAERTAAKAIFDTLLYQLYSTNADLLIARNTIHDLEEKEKQQGVVEPVFKRPRPVVAVMTGEAEIVAGWVKDINNIVRRGLTRVATFCGAVGVRLREIDERRMYKWDPDVSKSIDDRLEIIPPAETVAQFVAQTTERVGSTLVALFLETTKKEVVEEEGEGEFHSLDAHIDPCFDLDELEEAATRGTKTMAEQFKERNQVDSMENELKNLDVRRKQAGITAAQKAELDARYQALFARINTAKTNTFADTALSQLLRTDAERKFAPAWAFEVMGSGVFRYFLSTTSIAAFEMAHAEVKRIPGCSSFTLKELICSPGVMDKFAFLVASTHLSSGDNIPQSNSVNRGRNATYINVMSMRRLLADSMYTCKIWFESVRARRNPIVTEFQKKIDAGPPAWSELGKLIEQSKVYEGPGSEAPKPADHVFDDPDDRDINDQRLLWRQKRKEWEERMIKYRDMLPQRELVYRE